MKTSIGVIGVGVVGGAVVEFYKNTRRVFVYDKAKKIGNIGDAGNADFVFLCLPTPTNKGVQDLSAFDEVVPDLPAGKLVIIKSTTLPGMTARFQKMRPDVRFLHNPEFLSARTAISDFARPDLQVVGYTDVSKPDAGAVMDLLPPAPHAVICKSDESEMVKYFFNTFMSTKNIFANQIYDYCAKKGIDYEKVKNIAKLAPCFGGEVHLNVFADGYRGFAGHCLPKDLSALLADASASDLKLELLELVERLNQEYLKHKS